MILTKTKNRKLTDIRLLKQPKNENTCGVYCIKMVEKYYDKPDRDINNIWLEISNIAEETGRRIGKTYKIGQSLIKTGLNVSIIKFINLKPILEYCKDNQIPAIMNIHSFVNNALGHFVVFVNYVDDTIIIRDPEDIMTAVNYSELETNFVKQNDNDEIGGNIIILPVEDIQNKREYICPYCKTINIIDSEIIDHVEALICTSCDKGIVLSEMYNEDSKVLNDKIT